MSERFGARFARTGVPNARGLVERGGNDALSVPTEFRIPDLPLVSERRSEWLPGGRVPDARRAVGRCRQHFVAVRTETDVKDFLLVFDGADNGNRKRPLRQGRKEPLSRESVGRIVSQQPRQVSQTGAGIVALQQLVGLLNLQFEQRVFGALALAGFRSRQTLNLLGLALLVEVTRRRQDGDGAGDRADSGQPGEPFFQQVHALDRFAALQQRQITPQFSCRFVTHPHLRFARFQQHLVKLAPHWFVG